MATVHMSVHGTNGCFIGGIFFIQPRKCEERCGIYIWNAAKRWKILINGLLYPNIKVCEIFL
jgi:hypothetical protein